MSASVLLFTGILSGPVSSLLLGYPSFLVTALYPIAGIARLGWRWMTHLLIAACAPAALAVYGIAVGNSELAARAVRWCLALSAGMYFAGELDTAALISRIRTEAGGPFRGALRSVLLLLSLAGPAASRAGETFAASRRSGVDLPGSIENSVMSLREPFEAGGGSASKTSPLPVVLAALSWVLMLWAVSGTGTGS